MDGPPPPTGRRIVVVEDNADGREMLGELLRLLGHQVLLAQDGPGGLEMIGRERPDVALIDIGLPALDGYQVAEKVRLLPGGDKIVLVAMTGYGQPEDRRKALVAGFDAHLLKPVRLEELEKVLALGPAPRTQ